MAEDCIPVSKSQYIHNLTDKLNNYTKAYDEAHPIISDKEWDELYYELERLEKETGIYYPSSPTQSISYEIVNGLEKVQHDHKMLSLAKTKDIEEIKSFIQGKDSLAMSKMDGLTVSLHYQNGRLVRGETRGNGEIGEVITHNAEVIKNVPQAIDYPGELIVDGEVICTYQDFENVSNDYKNPRNYASGSIRLLDAKESAQRNLTFIAWDCISNIADTLFEKLDKLDDLGFTVVPRRIINSSFDNQYLDSFVVESLLYESKLKGYPIDGLVFKYNNCIEYSKLGETAHHPRGGLAYKLYDDTYKTHLRSIEWQLGRTGQICPVAIFEPVEIEGSTVEKASLSNISVMRETLHGTGWAGQIIEVSKRNLIIPKVEWAEADAKQSLLFAIPEACPVCGGRTIIRNDVESEILYCDNPDCSGKFITALNHFCSKNGLDIKGISEATLEKLIDWGWVKRFGEIFTLAGHRDEWIKKPGFGPASVDKILTAINQGSHCELSSYISALGIPLVGINTAKELTKYFSTWQSFMNAVESNYPFYQLPGFGREISQSLTNFNYTEARYIAHNFISFAEPKEENNNSAKLSGKTICITGKISNWKNRDELKAYIEELGGKVASSVSGKTSYLINNDLTSSSTKNNQAKKFGIPIITEEDFLNLVEN